ncbi:TPA: ParA family protein [Vibrio parahaemolyticus]
MSREPMASLSHSKAVKILVLNRKGGSGKSTLSAGLVSHLLSENKRVAVIDFDQQQSLSAWSSTISGVMTQQVTDKNLRPIQLAVKLKVPVSTDAVIMDSPSNFTDFDLERYVRFADHIIVPIQPSPVDLHAVLPFIAMLISHPAFNHHRMKLGLVITRVGDRRETLDKVLKLLTLLRQYPCLGIQTDNSAYQDLFHNKSLLLNDIDAELWTKIYDWIKPSLPLHPVQPCKLPQSRYGYYHKY